jgi:hypothetical protein
MSDHTGLSLKAVLGIAVPIIAALVGFVALAGGAVVSLAASNTAGGPPSAAATADIPSAMLSLYQHAATTCPGLPWTVLAAIGTVESDNDQSNLPGVHSGANSAGAEVISSCGSGCRHVSDVAWLSRACEVSARCEARPVRVPAL